MSYRIRRAAGFVALACTWLAFDALPALAQLVEPDLDAQPGISQTTELVTSEAELRRAVFGLLGIAAAAGILFFLYWYKTGQQARQRFAREFTGRHVEPTGPSRRWPRRRP
jgi:hypothetical protein